MNIAHEVSASSPAEIYEQKFVPALFRQWGAIISDLVGAKSGERILDVACGTGVLACAALERVGSQGKVVGLDPNPDMLSVARRKTAQIDWREGRAEAIPFPDNSFEAVVSQFGLMFFEDRPAAFREMMRVLRPNGRLAVAVCDALDNSPGYAAFAELLQKLFGAEVANAFRAPFVLGDPDRLLSICAEAGIVNAKVARHNGLVRFASIEAMVSTERACVWTLGGILDDSQFAELLRAAEAALKGFVTADGAMTFDMPALIVTAGKA
jgi:ubiquinone/menaquinone biosynthesis C-methylase UbiE